MPQNRLAMEKFGGAGFAVDRDLLAAIYDRPDNIPYVTRRGGLLYNLWKDKEHPRGLWRRTTIEEFRKPDPQWDVVLDIDRLAADEDQDWLLNWTQTLPPRHSRAILSLSRGGSDAVRMREFDIETKGFLDQALCCRKQRVALHGLTPIRCCCRVRTATAWRRRQAMRGPSGCGGAGRTCEAAPVIFATTAENMAVYVDVDRTGASPRVWFAEKLDFFHHHIWLGDETGARQRLELPTDAWMEAHQDWLAVKLRSAWTVGGQTYAADTVLGMPLSAFLAGDRNFKIIFEAGPRRALQGWFWTSGKLVLSILDELRPVFDVCTPSADGWSHSALRGIPGIGVVDVWRLDGDEAESNGDLLANIQDPLTPPALMLIEKIGSPTPLKQAPRTFSPEGLVVTQHEAISVDGERIPYVQTGPSTETGDAPLYMSAYGGFGHAVKPYYSSALGKLWLERGGTCVQANIRGGGEFGTRWHDAGRYAGKRLAHDDFAAVAADLVRRGVTRPSRIAAEGGSNGGILITNMLVRYPERFGALFCTIPLIDMRRYSKLLAGRQLDRRIWRPRQAGGMGLAADILRLSPRQAGPKIPADPVRHHAARRSRPSRPRPQDDGEAAGDGV